MQLASFGAQDAYLTGSPQVTYFKLTYRRHSNFAIESIRQTFDGTADFGKSPTVSVSRNGDLLGAMWLEITLPDLLAYDITPAPSEGNTANVLALANVYSDASGNYYQGRTGSLGSYIYNTPIALTDGVGNYYASGTPGNVASLTGNLTTWPYMIVGNTANPAIRTFTTPKTDLRYVNGIGMAFVKSVELEIGGQRIDKHYSEWWDVWSELTEPAEKKTGIDAMVGKYADYTPWQRQQSRSRTYYVPLRFCFNRSSGLHLPLVALASHQIKFNFEFRNYLELIRATVPVTALTAKAGAMPLSVTSCDLFADYVFLNNPERIRMSEMQHEYLVTQLQFQGDEPTPSPTDPNGTVNRKYTLNFIHPVKELVWVYQAASRYDVDARTGNDIFNYEINTATDPEVFKTCKLVLNGSDRFSVRNGSYFRLMQPYEHHTRVPSKSVYAYSFALKPEEDQPSGTANFSRFDSAQMSVTLNPALPAGRVKFFATSYNVLRVASGMAGLAFAS
jgi:hypothetical protein